MYKLKEMKSKKILMGRLDHGSDFLEAVTKICEDNNITMGRVEAMGALQKG